MYIKDNLNYINIIKEDIDCYYESTENEDKTVYREPYMDTDIDIQDFDNNFDMEVESIEEQKILYGYKYQKICDKNFIEDLIERHDDKVDYNFIYNLLNENYDVSWYGFELLTNEDEFNNQKSKTAKTKIFKVLCPSCKKEEVETNFSNFRRTFGGNCYCKRCIKSNVEKETMDFLIFNNIKFKDEFIFNDLKSKLKKLLRFDFGIFDNNNKLKCLIELDGKQHFVPVAFHKNNKINQDKNFEKQKYHDKLKNEYCIKNNIELIRIPYWKFDKINEILTKILIKNEKIDEFILK